MTTKTTAPNRKLWILYNALGFNVAWWACVLGASNGLPWLGPVVMAAYLAVHFVFVSRSPKEGAYILTVALAGLAIDTVKNSSGFITYHAGWPLAPWLAPLWIVAMWAGFAAMINHALAWLQGRYLLAFVLGAVFGPPSYLAGVRFGILEFNLSMTASVLILAAVWGTALVGLVWLANRMLSGGRHDSLHHTVSRPEFAKSSLDGLGKQ